MISLTCRIKKNHTNEFICRTETDSQTLKTNYGYQKGQVAGRDGLRVWDWPVHTEIYVMTGQWDLLYNTENSTQYSAIIYVGKESEREWMCVYV